MGTDLIKVLIKVLDEDKDKQVWEHVCYAPRDLYLDFIQKLELERFEFADFLSRWAKEDFNIDIPMTLSKDIEILRALVLDKYSSAYPHLLRKSATDRQGWIRVWVSTHMERELQKR